MTDLSRVVEIISAEFFKAMPDYYEAYENASEEERDQIDFMMGL